ncbi:MAG: putative component of anaerobic [Desulfobulbaceae bacterium]|nr:MAG: putative component of anaerobic [Desulfobulbaceae bacterium]
MPLMSETSTSQDLSFFYRFLARCMQYPDPQWMNEDFFQAFFNLVETLGANAEGKEIQVALEQSPDPIEALQIEYTRLFINGAPHVVAPPYASVYMDKSLQGAFALKTLSFYRAKGFAMEKDADLPDHLIHELEFLSLLAQENDLAGEEEFLTTLFRPWYKQFCPRVGQETRHPYYRMVVNLIDFFTTEEKKNGFQCNEA